MRGSGTYFSADPGRGIATVAQASDKEEPHRGKGVHPAVEDDLCGAEGPSRAVKVDGDLLDRADLREELVSGGRIVLGWAGRRRG